MCINTKFRIMVGGQNRREDTSRKIIIGYLTLLKHIAMFSFVFYIHMRSIYNIVSIK